jgi:hypothetical protein
VSVWKCLVCGETDDTGSDPVVQVYCGCGEAMRCTQCSQSIHPVHPEAGRCPRCPGESTSDDDPALVRYPTGS